MEVEYKGHDRDFRIHAPIYWCEDCPHFKDSCGGNKYIEACIDYKSEQSRKFHAK